MLSYLTFVRDNFRWLAGGFLLTFFSTIGQTSFIGFSAGHIRSEFEMSSGAYGSLFTAATLASALTLPRSGLVVDHYSVRQVTIAIVPLLALGAALMAFSHHVVALFLALYLLRLFGQGMMGHNAYTAAGRWFSAQRGRALSTVILGHNAGDAVFPILFVAIAGTFGWRQGWLLAAAALMLVALPLITLLVAVERTPKATDPLPPTPPSRHWTRAEALRDPVFHLLLLGSMVPGFVVTSVFFHQVYLVDQRGWSIEVFASSFALAALINTVFTLLVGHLIDHFSGIKLLPFVLLPLGVACFVLGTVEAQWSVFVFMALIGVSNGLSTTLFGALWPEVYGLTHLGAIRAVVVAAGVVATAIGPGLTGILMDQGVGLPGQIVAMGLFCFVISLVLALVSRRALSRVAIALQ